MVASLEKTKNEKISNLKSIFSLHFNSVTPDEHNKATYNIIMDPNQQTPQYPPQFFYPDPNQQMYPPQGVQPMMVQPGMVPPQYQMPQQHQQVVMMAPTTGYMVQPQSPTMTMVGAPMGHNVVPATIPQQVAYVTPSPDNVSLLTSPTPSPFDQSIKERLFQVSSTTLHACNITDRHILQFLEY